MPVASDRLHVQPRSIRQWNANTSAQRCARHEATRLPCASLPPSKHQKAMGPRPEDWAAPPPIALTYARGRMQGPRRAGPCAFPLRPRLPPGCCRRGCPDIGGPARKL
ncbi:unnamed protein product [Amoebophrya sp. A120]|nr:unnamed protein product [Amoebophrya sp. A120]|eukprot:GSA120T00015154001.1